MSLARAPRASRRRPATRAVLRALATLAALLVGLGSLGQFAHFLLVPHAICAEHGELLELGEDAGHAVSHASPRSDGTAHASSAPLAEHEHCEVLARGQREQAQPTPPTVALFPGSVRAASRPAIVAASPAEGLSALSVAPKTSPPSPSIG